MREWGINFGIYFHSDDDDDDDDDDKESERPILKQKLIRNIPKSKGSRKWSQKTAPQQQTLGKNPFVPINKINKLHKLQFRRESDG